MYFDVPKTDPTLHKDKLSDSHEWASQQSKIGTFSTIGGFWSLLNNLAVPSRIPLDATYSCFQSHIKPAWEDIHNTEGGEIRIFFNKTAVSAVDSAWSALLLSAVGETLIECEAIVCGLTVSRKKHKSKIAVWINRSDPASRLALEEAMSKAIGADVLSKLGLVLEWTSHATLLDKEKLKYSASSLPGAATVSSSGSNSRHSSGSYVPLKQRNLKNARPASTGDAPK
jgi:hypothetical protein